MGFYLLKTTISHAQSNRPLFFLFRSYSAPNPKPNPNPHLYLLVLFPVGNCRGKMYVLVVSDIFLAAEDDAHDVTVGVDEGSGDVGEGGDRDGADVNGVVGERADETGGAVVVGRVEESEVLVELD